MLVNLFLIGNPIEEGGCDHWLKKKKISFLVYNFVNKINMIILIFHLIESLIKVWICNA